MIPNDDVGFVWKAFLENLKQKSSSHHGVDDNLCSILTGLGEAYNNAQHRTVRRQILLIMAKNIAFSVMSMVIPNLTEYRFYVTCRHVDLQGRCVVVDDLRPPPLKIDHFEKNIKIEFLL